MYNTNIIKTLVNIILVKTHKIMKKLSVKNFDKTYKDHKCVTLVLRFM